MCSSLLGGTVDMLASGALVVTMPQMASATDQATRAAHAALTIKKHWPTALVSLSTGHGSFQGRTVVGAVVDQAARFLRRDQDPNSATPPPMAVFVDELSARLLKGRFAQTPQTGGALLLGVEKEADVS